jgi:hypothetical protein
MIIGKVRYYQGRGGYQPAEFAIWLIRAIQVGICLIVLQPNYASF